MKEQFRLPSQIKKEQEKLILHELEMQRLKLLAQKNLEYNLAYQQVSKNPKTLMIQLGMIEKKLGPELGRVIGESLKIMAKALTPEEMQQLKIKRDTAMKRLELPKKDQKDVAEKLEKINKE
ncbi:MAG: hypothetical protein A2Y82_00410 [Candidatus Buchananbacteria bacterium RBG_13_36_9]|uniref:Uncharacterized protein n=1 Tax=Candidatus Buchananbacteria bacterium RBG_13_36_9 TaxID=1797530 RepID=A0A1G1XQ57_9BACT|nr:MAG: hypothetical protein A2Y82_00410 [Candidatus Buchananbacteria bacterium RBG_13_36_9]